LGTYNVLVLDEPGNHLDVDTVEALAEALLEYKGTVIFTSHDRHFMKRVATCIVEVREAHVTNYRGQYDAYLYAVNKEIEDGEREREITLAKAPLAATCLAKPATRPTRKSERELRKEISTVEKSIARLDGEKRSLTDQLLKATDPADALRLHNEVAAITTQLTEAEERWCVLQEEIGAAE